ncbi:MAG: hypothetical protein AMXMBFR34_44980 [Myxococcaceae bacterium]
MHVRVDDGRQPLRQRGAFLVVEAGHGEEVAPAGERRGETARRAVDDFVHFERPHCHSMKDSSRAESSSSS